MTDPDITPDDKDWTWVLDRVCSQCGHDVADLTVEEVGALVQENAADWAALLAALDEATLRRRPRPDTWSPLEYAAHVRDVFALYDERLELMLTQDGPEYPNWDQDATAVAERYNTQDPAVVSTQLVAEAARLAARFDGVTPEQRNRTGFRSDGAAFTFASFARYLIHDPLHHLWDVRRDLG